MSLSQDDARQAERYEKLAAAAFERFKVRLDWEWKARVALWTALAVGTGFVVTSETWHPTTSEVSMCVLLAVTVTIIYGLFFAIPVHLLHQHDIAQRMEWDWKIAQLCDPTLQGTMPKRSPALKMSAMLLSIGQFLVTSVFAAALAAAVLNKASAVNQPASSKIVIEGRDASEVLIKPSHGSSTTAPP